MSIFLKNSGLKILITTAVLVGGVANAAVCTHSKKDQNRLEILSQVAKDLDSSSAKQLIRNLILELHAEKNASTAIELVLFVQNVESCDESIDPKITQFEAALFRHRISY